VTDDDYMKFEGIDPRDPQYWQKTDRIIKRIVEDFEARLKLER